PSPRSRRVPSRPTSPPHPHPTPSPYTTLFRSLPVRGPDALPGHLHLADDARRHQEQGRRKHHLQQVVPKPPPPGTRPTEPLAGGDRKSTRLNSSHVAISYAVFCLKKKKSS